MSAEQTLLPCPFCGEKTRLHPGDILAEKHEPDSFRASCRGCRAESAVFGTSEEAIAAWNRRHQGDALRAGTMNEARAAHGSPLAKLFVTLPAPPPGFEPPPRTVTVEVEVCASPSLAKVQALAERCKTGDLDACVEYQEAAKALLDDVWSTLRGDSERDADREQLWRAIVDLNTELLNARDRESSC